MFLTEQFTDPTYQGRRDGLFVVAADCTQPGGTCFCASMKTGPEVTTSFDLALTEIVDAEHHYFVVRVGSNAGATVLRDVPHRAAGEEDLECARRLITRAAGRTFAGHVEHQGALADQLRPSGMATRGRSSDLRQLHDGLSYLFLLVPPRT